MNKYPFHAYTRVAFPPYIGDISAPTLTEIGQAGEDDYFLDVYTDEYIGSTTWIYDIHCELTASGLRLPKSTASTDVTPWYGGLIQERPTRYGMSGASLEAFRYKPPAIEVMWNGALFKAQRFLVVRRGIPVEEEWDSGDPVEVYRVTMGKRFCADSAPDTLTTFTVPLFVTAEDDNAVVA